MGTEYWSCSKFADWLRGTPKPMSGTIEEWNAWEKSARKKRVRYWLAEDGLDYLENFIYWPKNTYNRIRNYFTNRWINKTHALTSHLERGVWHDYDMRLLHAAFDALVDFVEVEQALMNFACASDEDKKSMLPHFKGNRSAKVGLDYLEWATSLKNDEEWFSKDDPEFGKPTSQALAAQQTLDLYRWWKEKRPNRPDPFEASGWSDYCDKMEKEAIARGEDGCMAVLHSKTPEEREISSKISAICSKMEQEQEDEDTEMLILLVKIRKNLWT